MTDAMRASTITICTNSGRPGGDEIEAYLAEPYDRGKVPGIVVIHHMPGYDRETKEFARTFAVRGYAALVPNLYHRYAPGAKWSDATAAARAAGGPSDDQVMGDVKGAIDHLKGLADANGKIGVIGYCSGGRHTFLAACTFEVDAAVDCYGGGVVIDSPEQITPQRPVPPIELTPKLSCPLLGLFGDDDQSPTPAHVATLAAELKAHGKSFEFHSYPDAGHAFFSVDYPMYARDAAREGWKEIWKFFGEHLGGA